jgi:hypothetical protein
MLRKKILFKEVLLVAAGSLGVMTASNSFALSHEELPNTIIIKVEVVGDEEQNPVVYMVNSATRLTNGDEAQALNVEAEKSNGTVLRQNQTEKDCPEQLTMLTKLAGLAYDPENEATDNSDSWGFNMVSPFGSRGYFYGSGRGNRYGYHPDVHGYRHPSYGYYYGNNYFPYIPSNYYHRNGPSRYYYYHSPYYRW